MKNAIWIVIILACVAMWGRAQRMAGQRAVELAALKSVNDSLQQVQTRIDTVYQTDTIRLWRTLAKYDTARVTDTLVRNDTVYVRRDVADAAVEGCKLTVLTCEQRVEVRDKRINNLEQQIKKMPQERSAFWTWAERLGWGFAGYKLGQLTVP